MIVREAEKEVFQLLEEFPAVGLLGPRQVGKTTLAETIAETLNTETVYLDLETPSEIVKLKNPESFFNLNIGKLIILDEVQRMPEVFAVLRGAIDRRRKEGFRTAQFLILGSASLDLLQQSSESLAGRIAYKELSGLLVTEVGIKEQNNLWLRGGFPDSFLARSDEASLRWRTNFISTYLERDVPQFGSRIPSTSLRLLWTMLAHAQGTQLNTSKLGANLGITAPTAKKYIELLEDLLLIRTLRPWSGNIGKRLVKSPKVYIRDSGIAHALLNIVKLNDLLGHPVVGASWEGFVIENLMGVLPEGATAWFYRTAAGAEIDLVIEKGPEKKYAIEIKKSDAPVLSKGFYLGCEDIGATHRFVVYSGNDRYPGIENTQVLSLTDMMEELRKM
ncbi:ATP-binding protein [Pseudoflavitalea sp. G-6-1-2]|uniref:ATP-binding protein n=1 Tax=Pseudoflavitalea sp. G-6-1-2 TaxID=2728841 RepID=UPI00146EFFA2|nr:ATP-binding protein [Pseudoflavitalea sp. G-6-1-2]NML20231.1 ATP-binding protein [Pseudoflavitalea sp. G-6-1-2]